MSTVSWTCLPEDARDLILARILHGVNGLDAWRVPKWIYGIVCASRSSGGIFSNPSSPIWKRLCGLLGLDCSERMVTYAGSWKNAFRGVVFDCILLSGILRLHKSGPQSMPVRLQHDVAVPCIEGVDLADVKNIPALSIRQIKDTCNTGHLFGRRLSVLRFAFDVVLTRYTINKDRFDVTFCSSIDSKRVFRHADADPMPMLYFLLGVLPQKQPPRPSLNFGRGMTMRFVEQTLHVFGETHKVPSLGLSYLNTSDEMLHVSSTIAGSLPFLKKSLSFVRVAVKTGGAPQKWKRDEIEIPNILQNLNWAVSSEVYVHEHFKELLKLFKMAGIDDRLKERFPEKIKEMIEELPSWRSMFVDTLPTLDTRAL